MFGDFKTQDQIEAPSKIQRRPQVANLNDAPYRIRQLVQRNIPVDTVKVAESGFL